MDDGVGSRAWFTDRTARAVYAVAALALAVRLVGLGTRIFHWDEGRVGYWILRYQETGAFAYRPIIHGPFVQVVNRHLFALVGASDFSARLPVALVGALLPLSALLLRERLRDTEVVALAALLSLDPLLVYYSRFMRSDVLVAAFAFVAFAFLVYAIDARDVRFLYPAVASMGLSVASKENALVYLACFAGAGVLLYDHRLVRQTRTGRNVWSVLRSHADRGLDAVAAVGDRDRWDRLGGGLRPGLARVLAHGVGLAVAFLTVVVFFYAPRPDLWNAVAAPAQLPGVVDEALFGSWDKLLSIWGVSGEGDYEYLSFLYDLLESVVYGSGVVAAFALVGVAVDGYLGDARDLVAYATYWAGASVLGYPVATDIQAPWLGVHVAVPLAIPAAVGLAAVARSLRDSVTTRDAVGASLAGLVLLGAVVGVVAPNVDYVNSTDEEDKQVLQWAQPHNDLKPTLETIHAVSAENDGVDVLFYGTHPPHNPSNVLFYVSNESSLDQPPPGGPSWHSRLPLPWYLERYGANVTSTPPGTPPESVAADAPPVVVAYSWNRTDLAPHLDGYRAYEHDFKLWGEQIVVFVDESALAAATENESAGTTRRVAPPGR